MWAGALCRLQHLHLGTRAVYSRTKTDSTFHTDTAGIAHVEATTRMKPASLDVGGRCLLPTPLGTQPPAKDTCPLDKRRCNACWPYTVSRK